MKESEEVRIKLTSVLYNTESVFVWVSYVPAKVMLTTTFPATFANLPSNVCLDHPMQ